MRSFRTCSVGNKSMRTFRPVSGFIKSGLWICDRCLRGQREFPHLYNTYATKVTLRPVPSTFILEQLRTKSTSAQHPTSGTLASSKHSPYRAVSENSKANRRNLTILLVTLLSAGTILAFSDSVKHSYTAVTRSLRVLIALSQSVREYVLREGLSVACGKLMIVGKVIKYPSKAMPTEVTDRKPYLKHVINGALSVP